MSDKDILLGQLSANVENLTEAVDALRGDLRFVRAQLAELALFRAKVVGAAATVSILASAVFTIAARAWGH